MSVITNLKLLFHPKGLDNCDEVLVIRVITPRLRYSVLGAHGPMSAESPRGRIHSGVRESYTDILQFLQDS